MCADAVRAFRNDQEEVTWFVALLSIPARPTVMVLVFALKKIDINSLATALAYNTNSTNAGSTLRKVLYVPNRFKNE
ncbi:MAG TPA: hypothetical protein DEF72_00630 [Gammaproteobacteria bacterium]|nr:hypothetical protein [Gammaproteobacteria bacterium]